jgi:hypothetical protein
MANVKFPDFPLKTNLSAGDYIVGYRADGTSEFRTTLGDLITYIQSQVSFATPTPTPTSTATPAPTPTPTATPTPTPTETSGSLPPPGTYFAYDISPATNVCSSTQFLSNFVLNGGSQTLTTATSIESDSFAEDGILAPGDVAFVTDGIHKRSGTYGLPSSVPTITFNAPAVLCS